MKKKIFILMVCFTLSINLSSGQTVPVYDGQFDQLNNSHDIQLGAWGPYAKQYAGISHIADVKSGLRFDFSVMPGYYRNKLLIPNVRFESGYFPWNVNNELNSYTYRYELEWKDKVFIDVTYAIVDSGTVMAAMKFVNHTALPQTVTLNLMAYIGYPEIFPNQTLNFSKNSVWINAADYKSIAFAKPQPKDNLVSDGLMRGEVRGADYIDGSAIAMGFGKMKGDKVTYDIALKAPSRKGTITVLYKMKENAKCTFRLGGVASGDITLTGTGGLAQKDIPVNLTKAGARLLTIASEGGDPIALNGLLFTSEGQKSDLHIAVKKKNFQPEIISNTADRKVILKYKDIPLYYGISWDHEVSRFREVRNDELDIYFRELVHNHVDSVFTGNNQGHFSNIFIGPVALAPSSDKTIYSLICAGNLKQVKERLAQFTALKEPSKKSSAPAAEHQEILPNGKKYEFSQRMLRAALMENIVYPIYTQRNYIRHYTPGKWWNSLYTWDSGFVALGLNEVNKSRAIECINAYTTPLGSQSAFIHHGSPVPVQMYAFFDLWNKTQSKELLQYFYPRLKQYYEFLAGRSGSSSTHNLKSGLISTWDYFYNSGGWDDYPAQVGVHQQKAEATVTPVISTAQCIRVAKLLRFAADELRQQADIAMYDKDIKSLSAALQNYSWNKTSGYFSYVLHDDKGNPLGAFNYQNGQDYNMGLDGAYPLLSGICSQEQERDLIDKIFSEKHMWTPSGIGVVDQSAPYYRIDGYWNGSVWMPHQWFMWKTMLDLGRPELALKIAEKGLEVFSKETDESYYTFEHFFAKTGRGAGWHQFSGLSTPVLSWFAAYYKIGTATTGFEIWIKSQSFNQDNSSYQAKISFDQATSAHPRSMILCMNPSYLYKVTISGKEAAVKSPYPGLLQISFPASNKEGVLKVQPLNLIQTQKHEKDI